MKKLISAAVFLTFVLAGMSFADDAAQPKEHKGKGAEKDITANCPECAAFKTQIDAKNKTITDLRAQIKEARDAEKEKRLAALKESDPKKYDEIVAKMAEHKANKGETKKPLVKTQPTTEQREARLAELQKNNPAAYALEVQMQKLQAERKDLMDQMKACVEACKGKKGTDNKKDNSK